MTKLTLDRLIDAKACSDQLALFKSKFGLEVEITGDLCRAEAFVFHWDWAARFLLTSESRVKYFKRMCGPLTEYENTLCALSTYRADAARSRAVEAAVNKLLQTKAATWAALYQEENR